MRIESLEHILKNFEFNLDEERERISLDEALFFFCTKYLRRHVAYELSAYKGLIIRETDMSVIFALSSERKYRHKC